MACSEGLLQIAEDTLKSIVRKDSIREFYQIDNKTPLGRYVDVIFKLSMCQFYYKFVYIFKKLLAISYKTKQQIKII